MNSNIDYTRYTFEDFLQDDYFIFSCKNPTEVSIIFWNEYLAKAPDNLQEYLIAKEYLNSIPEKKGDVSDNEIEELWDRISERNKKRIGRKKILLFTLSAASIFLFLFLSIFIEHSEKDELYQYVVAQVSSEMPEIEDAQLILSENKTVLVEEKESVITYEPNEIKIAGKNVEIEDIASYNQLIVPKGKRSLLTLSDGTEIWVNSGTKVVYPVEFSEKQRELYVNGEIYLSVARDESKPFIVKTADMNIQVLGTDFNITAYETDDIKNVVLVSGSVKITPRKNKNNDLVMEPGYMYELTNSGGTLLKVDVRKFISWKDGMYIYDNEKLRNIIRRLERYYGKRIDYDEASAELLFTGKLDLKANLADVLMGLTYTAPVVFDNNNGEYKIFIK